MNLFSYTCSLSVVAKEGRSKKVVNFNMSSKALNIGRTNQKLNGHEMNRIHFFAHNIFKSFSKIKRFGSYHLIICDPPSDQGESFTLKTDYPKLLNKNGELILCCNSPLLKSYFLIDMAWNIYQIIN